MRSSLGSCFMLDLVCTEDGLQEGRLAVDTKLSASRDAARRDLQGADVVERGSGASIGFPVQGTQRCLWSSAGADDYPCLIRIAVGLITIVQLSLAGSLLQ